MAADGDTDTIQNNQLIDWKFLPSEALIGVFEYLSYKDLCQCCQVCKQWSTVGNISSLWRIRFTQDFDIAPDIDMSSATNSWKKEYERLTDTVPSVEWECLSEHSDEVLHVSFSHNGMMFCTCSKDATTKVFRAECPCSLLFSENCGRNSLFNWSYTQYSQFNSNDSELLVSGRCDGSVSGEIIIYAIFSDALSLQARIRIQPYDVMGVWLNESHILSSRCHRFPFRNQCFSEILLNKSSQEVENLRQSTVNRLFMFSNSHAIDVGYLKVADMTEVMSQLYRSVATGCFNGSIHEMHSRILFECEELSCSQCDQSEGNRAEAPSIDRIGTDGGSCRACWSPQTNRLLFDKHLTLKPDTTAEAPNGNVDPHFHSLASLGSGIVSYKLLLASTGTEMNLSHHVIAMKLITQEKCDNVKDASADYKSRQTEYPVIMHRSIQTDEWDNTIDVGGQLVGMEVSPCMQYLYASYRKFTNHSSEQFSPLEISSIVTISLYDLISMSELMVFNGPSAFSNVFYLFLSCAGEYLASGSEDNQGYLWDKYYGCIVSNLKHNDVVNCVAINPCDTGMAVSVSDDHTVKIWHSKSFVRSTTKANKKCTI